MPPRPVGSKLGGDSESRRLRYPLSPRPDLVDRHIASVVACEPLDFRTRQAIVLSPVSLLTSRTSRRSSRRRPVSSSKKSNDSRRYDNSEYCLIRHHLFQSRRKRARHTFRP